VAGLPLWTHRLIERMPFVNDPGNQRSVSVSLGQNIYTPEDKERSDLILDDRPYAGIAYLGLGLHSKSRRQMDTLEFGIGVVGRHSYAEDCQQEIHNWTDRDSHSVDKKPFVADLIGGVGMIIHRVKITYSYVHRTREFKTQKDEQHFGAFAVSFTF
jgi:hypothetical protein